MRRSPLDKSSSKYWTQEKTERDESEAGNREEYFNMGAMDAKSKARDAKSECFSFTVCPMCLEYAYCSPSATLPLPLCFSARQPLCFTENLFLSLSLSLYLAFHRERDRRGAQHQRRQQAAADARPHVQVALVVARGHGRGRERRAQHRGAGGELVGPRGQRADAVLNGGAAGE